MDDDDYDIEDIELILDEDEYEADPIPDPGLSRWSIAWIAFDAASTILKAMDHIVYNIKVDLVTRHNKVVDEETFIGSVEAGIEQL